MYVANVGSHRGAGNGNRVDQKEAAGFNSAQRSTDAGNRKIGSQGSRIGSINQELRLNCRREHSCSAIVLNCWPDRSSEKIGQAMDEETDNRQP